MVLSSIWIRSFKLKRKRDCLIDTFRTWSLAVPIAPRHPHARHSNVDLYPSSIEVLVTILFDFTPGTPRDQSTFGECYRIYRPLRISLVNAVIVDIGAVTTVIVDAPLYDPSLTAAAGCDPAGCVGDLTE